MGGKKICNWVVICEVMVLFSFRAGGEVFFFNCCAYMIPNNDEACRQAGSLFDLQYFFVFCFSEANGWYLGE